MGQLTMAQAYGFARQAGFDPAAAVVAAAIAAGESGLRTDARGDVGLQTEVWGPSVGLMQIRTLKAQTGTGGDRDIQRLSDPLQNMISAYNISHQGRDWTPWTVYNTGKYRDFLGQATSAAGDSSTPVAATPVGLTQDLATGARNWSVRLLIVTLGAGLVVAGTYRLWGPAVKKAGGVVYGAGKKAVAGAATGGAGAAVA